METYTLFELNEHIRHVLALNLPEALWIRCEIAQMNEARGHFYIDLVQKGEGTDEIVAQAAAVLWSKTYRKLKQNLGEELDFLLQEGIEVQLHAKVEFHERYGLKLVIENFDPAYTLGKLALKRREIIRELKKLRLLEKNGEVPIPPVLQRIAVLTSAGAAGYQDYLKQLDANSFGYRFSNTLFPTVVQGLQVEREMLAQLREIAKDKARFDCVIIIRGGGAKLDLSAFDSLALCKAVANFPLPILTGIGHEVDETVLDMVAHSALKTPTAVADFIIHQNLQFESEITELGLYLKNLTEQVLKENEFTLQQIEQSVHLQSLQKIGQGRQMLDFIGQELPQLLKYIFKKEKMQLTNLEKNCNLLNPQTVLNRGFSLTLKNGRALTSPKQALEGDSICSILREGTLHSLVKKTKDA